jgi:hypothetical protein
MTSPTRKSRLHPKPATPTPPPATAPPPDTPHGVAEGHFRAVEPELRALPSDAATPARIDVQAAAMTAIGAATRLEDAPLRARFLGLHKVNDFDASCVDRLLVVAWAVWYARHRFLAASGVDTNAQLPEALRASALEQRTRMMRIARYHLDADPTSRARLDQIDEGRGDQDLANDLIALAEVFRDFAELLRTDRFHRPDDVAQADALGAQIVAVLATGDLSAEAAAWQDLQNRAWALLNTVYDAVRRAATFILWRDSRLDEWFPSLVTASRAAPTRAAPPAAPAAPAAPVTPVTPVTPAT